MEKSSHSKVKNLGRNFIVYLGGAWVFIEAFNFIIDRYQLSSVYLDIIIIVVIFGLPASLIHSWFEGRFTRKAIFFQIINLAVALGVISYDVTNPRSINPTHLRVLRFKDNQKKLAESIQSIAILPFSNFTGDEEKDFLSFGIHDALINEMGHIGAIRVISRTSTLQYSGSNKTVKEIASELGVDAVIEGSLLVADNLIRVQVKLIGAYPEEMQLWSQTYDTPMDKLLNVYGEMAENIVNEVNITLTPREEALLKQSKTVDPQAYEAYLKGKYSMGQLSKEGIQSAIGYFNQSIAIDPDFAPAYGGLGGIWAFLKQMDVVPVQEANPHIISNLEKALELDSTLADVYYWQAIKQVWTDFDWDRGEKSFKKSIKLNPNLSESRALYSHLLICLNRWDESEQQMARALENDPANLFIKVLNLMRLTYLQEYDSATQLGASLQSSMPLNPLVNLALITVYSKTEKHKEALEQIKIKVKMEADTSLHEFIDKSYDEKGFKETLIETARILENLDGQYISAQTFLILYGLGSDKDKFLEWAERGYIRKDADIPYIGVNTQTIFTEFKDEPRIEEILKNLELPY